MRRLREASPVASTLFVSHALSHLVALSRSGSYRLSMACAEHKTKSRPGNDHIIPIRTGGNHPLHITREAQTCGEHNIVKRLEPTFITQARAKWPQSVYCRVADPKAEIADTPAIRFSRRKQVITALLVTLGATAATGSNRGSPQPGMSMASAVVLNTVSSPPSPSTPRGGSR